MVCIYSIVNVIVVSRVYLRGTVEDLCDVYVQVLECFNIMISIF